MAELFTDNDFPGDLQLNDLRKILREFDSSVELGIIEWKRPKEFIQHPTFVDHDGFNKFDVDQGTIGDCWFLSSVATVVGRHPDLFKVVVPPDQSFDNNYTGKFRFNFWSFDEWKTIEIDDRLPTQNGEHLFCRNRENPSEQWPSLIEKAYAKLNGTYAAIDGGWSENGLVDLTGGVGKRIDLTKRPLNLYTHLLKQDQMNTLLGSGTQGKDQEKEKEFGIMGGHAYSITKVAEITDLRGKKHQLLRLLNPWGQDEWKGAWSRRSRTWDAVDEETKKQYSDDISGTENGEFWISFEDWIRHYHDLSICYLPAKSTLPNGRRWHEQKFHATWVPGQNDAARKKRQDVYSNSYWADNIRYVISTPTATTSASKPRNSIHDFAMTDDNKTTLIVSLMRKVNDFTDTNVTLGLDIYKVKSTPVPELTSSSFQDYLEPELNRFQRIAGGRELSYYLNDGYGTYVIIPVFDSDVSTDYLLRVYSESELTSGAAESPQGSQQQDPKDGDSANGHVSEERSQCCQCCNVL